MRREDAQGWLPGCLRWIRATHWFTKGDSLSNTIDADYLRAYKRAYRAGWRAAMQKRRAEEIAGRDPD